METCSVKTRNRTMTNDIDKLKILYEVMNDSEQREIKETKLCIIGYGMEYLEYLSDDKLNEIYNIEFGHIDKI